jgi:hypothetical protein
MPHFLISTENTTNEAALQWMAFGAPEKEFALGAFF